MGQTFPDLTFHQGKLPRRLENLDGVLLVQLWNPG